MAKKVYKVTLPEHFPYDSRNRAGVTVSKAEGYVGELTDDQVKEIKADPELTLTEASDDEAKTAADAPDTGSVDETVTASGRVPNDTSGHGNPEGESGYSPDGQASFTAVPKKAGK